MSQSCERNLVAWGGNAGSYLLYLNARFVDVRSILEGVPDRLWDRLLGPRRLIFAVVLTFLPFLESILGYLSRLGGYLGPSWGRPGATPRTSWTVLGHRGGRFGPSEADCGGVREQPIRFLGAVGTPARVARGPRGRATKRGDRAK